MNPNKLTWFLITTTYLILSGCSTQEPKLIQQWTVHEIELSAHETFDNPFTQVNLWAVFKSSAGDSLVRPGFWDGNQSWKIRFAPPKADVTWTYETFANPEDDGLHGKKGTFHSKAYEGSNALVANGFLTMSKGKRTIVHQSGKAFPLVGDTPWALPFRATTDQAKVYAKDRQQKGFNAALLFSLQPDMESTGPDERDTPQGFKRAFKDLHQGHIRELVPEYFQYMDSLINILIDHEIVPVYQPVFHGFGWKGEKVLGNVIDPGEYVRYCNYLLARYGAQPAMWLIAGDNGGRDPGVKEAGEMLEIWDCYAQPTGLHYNPCDDYVASWAVNNPIKHCMHYNKTFQAEEWLDFQWAQTGHNGEHLYHKVERMYDDPIVKAVANGEPTYEGMGGGKNGLGWWQGEEAWMQMMSGGTMGVVYGAASLWQWKVTDKEEGWTDWASQPKSWEGAMKMEGSKYVGYVSKALEGLDFADIEKRWDLSDGKPLLAKEGQLYISYLNEGGTITIKGVPDGLSVRWFDPKTGSFADAGTTQGPSAGAERQVSFETPSEEPWVLIVGN